MKTRMQRLDSGEKRKKRWVTILIGLFIIIIMATSVINLWEGEEQGTYSLLGNKYIETENGFVAYAENKQIVLLTNPKEIENITFGDAAEQTSLIYYIRQLNGLSKIYLTYNPKENAKYAIYDFTRNIPLSPVLIDACWEDNELCKEVPIKDCKDASNLVGVILFKEANETKISFENNCLTIEGEDLLKAADKLIAIYYAHE